MTNETLIKLWSFYRYKIDVNEYEKWLYSNKDLELEIGNEIYLELITLNYKNKSDAEKIRNLIKIILDNFDYKCSCVKISSIDIIGMGSEEDYYKDPFTVIKYRGEEYWWLYLSQCSICKTYWLIAQEERHNDDYHLLRLNDNQAINIIDFDQWPNDFDSYENLLSLSKMAGHVVRFFDQLNSSMVNTVIDLAKNRPNINSIEIADLLNIDNELANELSKIATQKENVKIDIMNK